MNSINAGSPALDRAAFRRTLRDLGYSEPDITAEMRRLDMYPDASASISETSPEARRVVPRVICPYCGVPMATPHNGEAQRCPACGEGWLGLRETAPAYNPHDDGDRLGAPVAIRRTYVGEHYGRQEEGDCEACGAPMLVGDDAYEITDDGDPLAFACSMYCARSLALQHAEAYWIGPARRWSVPATLRERATYRAQGIQWDRFDICGAWWALAHDYGLYGLLDRLQHEVEYKPGLSGYSFDTLTENGQTIYAAGQERAAQMGPWERGIPQD